ncbi:MAG: TetR/AcrR family transcriptional regulator [Tannerellaceae bacterium]|jgi:AcrR family transcriptional regulator|nr:TetR/AcrR family transcriptional regulator [Tannerellaceae bacterium]
MNVEDKRIKLTKLILKDALVELIETKSINEISITELCRSANINRSTFYKYYSSPQELLRELTKEFINTILEKVRGIEDVDRILAIVCDEILKNRAFCIVVLAMDEDSGAQKYLISSLRNAFLGGDNESSKVHIRGYREAYFFNVYGAHAIIKNWVLTGFQEDSVFIAKIINHFVISVITSLQTIIK